MVFENMQWDSIEKWISGKKRRNFKWVVFSISTANYKSIQDLALWVNESLYIRRLKVKAEFDDAEFITIKMNEMVYKAYILYLDWKTNSDFSYNK